MKREQAGAGNNGERQVGLARALSKMGFCSRAKAGQLIRAGRVRLNGAVRRNPEWPVHLERDQIVVDGQAIATAHKIYIMLNKPRGAVTTASDEKGRETVYDYLGAQGGWLAPVGRLDKASEGLLLLSNDSEWAARVTAPKTRLEKIYHVQIAGIPDDALLQKLKTGVSSKGEFLRALRAGILRTGERNGWLEIILDEGKNRHIRRMMEELEIEVLRLVRVAIGPLALGDLTKGGSRPLTSNEKCALDRAMACGG